jgi:hypothetical protein
VTRTRRAPAAHGVCGRAARTSHGCMEGTPLGLRGRRDRRALKGTVQPWFTTTDEEPGGRGHVCPYQVTVHRWREWRQRVE